MGKTIRIEDFDFAGEARVEEGHRNFSPYSALFDEIIRRAAGCHHYASDAFYDMQSICEEITEREEGSSQRLIGFRDGGVDGTGHVLTCYSEPECYSIDTRYRYLMLVEVEITPCRSWDNRNGNYDKVVIRWGEAKLKERR